MDEEVNSLEEQARKRQERLKSLKRRREEKNDTGNDSNADNFEVTLPKPKFRSYRPQNKELTDFVIKKPEIADAQNEVKDLLDLAKNNTVIDQLDISALAPRQPDWDLKRDVQKKLEKLAKRTQKAMAELIREKLKEKQDLAEITSVSVDV